MSNFFISRERAESDLLAAAAYIGERIKSSDGHAEAMNAVVPRYLANGEVDLAAELANSVNDPYSRDRLLTLIAEKCAAIDDDEYALQLADAIEDRGLRVQAFERIGMVKAAKGEISKAEDIAVGMEHPDFVYSGIAVFQESDGDEASAADTLDRIEFASARVAAMLHIAAANIQKDEYQQAVKWLEKAVVSAHEIEHVEEKIRALCDVGNQFIEAKQNDKAVETFAAAREIAELLDNVHRDPFLATCALGFLHSGSADMGDSTLDLVTDKTSMASALLGFARDAWTKDAKDDAVETLEESYAILRSQREAETRDSRARNALLASIATQFAGFGKTERGVEIAFENPDPNERTGALTQIVRILTIQNEDELARQTLDEIDDDAGRLFAFIGMADVKRSQDKSGESIAFLDEAALMADSIPQLASRSGVLNEIAARFAEQGQTEKAREIISQNMSLISEILDNSSQAALLASIVDILDDSGMQISESDREHLRHFVRKTDT